MGDAQDRHVAYVRKINEEIREFVEGLTRENDRLVLELTRVEQDRAALDRKVRSLEDELTARSAEQDQVLHLVADITSDNSNLHARLTEVMAQTNDLTNLYVSSHQLHCTTDYDEVLGAIRDIVINIVGSEDFVVLARIPGETHLTLIQSFGADPGCYHTVDPGDTSVGEVLRTGRPWVANGNSGELPRWRDRAMTACVPLLFRGRVEGLLVIFSLLPQKPTLEQVDLELFELLAAQALGALNFARRADDER